MLSSYQELKKANPKLPILVRESEKAEAKLTARYDFGAETAVSVEGMDKAGITKQLEELVKRGESMPRCASPSSGESGRCMIVAQYQQGLRAQPAFICHAMVLGADSNAQQMTFAMHVELCRAHAKWT